MVESASRPEGHGFEYRLHNKSAENTDLVHVKSVGVKRHTASVAWEFGGREILLNDGIVTISFFIVSNLALLSIGSCGHTRAARLIAALFILGLFVMMLAQDYLNYLKWQEKRSAKEDGKNSSGTTITESSPTVLT
ncbi:hypothetical protein AVEN_124750-1 [Araneus ventricosus]|uniref:Uncharacterized protein n=1 Tax=Araneus ventricosus TaxID=182803 RepID=A0A4Y2W7S0_ARAVE|nr:hypothetical protein AVEN_124750-1 [Araneus ventricosus]